MPGFLSRIKASLPEGLRSRLVRLRRPRALYLLFPRLRPISAYAGRERGTPVDRYYIENFLAGHADRIRGRCLEVKDDAYTRRFGGDRVSAGDVLDVNPENPRANVHGDLRRLTAIADNTYDCFILTQTLQYIDDLESAVRECHRILRPGGALLVTLPCLGKIEGIENQVAGHFWRFTADSARYIFAKAFAPGELEGAAESDASKSLEVKSWGNVLAGMAFWAGMAQEDLPRRKLDFHDPAFPCVVTVLAVKGEGKSGVGATTSSVANCEAQ